MKEVVPSFSSNWNFIIYGQMAGTHKGLFTWSVSSKEMCIAHHIRLMVTQHEGQIQSFGRQRHLCVSVERVTLSGRS